MIEKPQTELPDFGSFVASAAAAGKLPTMAEVVAWFEAASEYDPWLRSAICAGLRHVLASYDARPQPLDPERQRLRDWVRVRLAQLDDGERPLQGRDTVVDSRRNPRDLGRH